jgi:hypothetical protein
MIDTYICLCHQLEIRAGKMATETLLDKPEKNPFPPD